MRVLGIALLSLVALLTGGCSLVFLFASFLDAQPFDTLQYIGVPILIGLAVAGICILLIRVIRRSSNTAPPQTQDPPQQQNERL